jgi:hypothetical protein
MDQQPIQHIAPGQGQWFIPRNEVDRGYNNYQTCSGGGGHTTTDAHIPIQTKSDVRFEATKELLITATNLKRAAKVLDDYNTRLFINIGTS